jgi:hypothetical protein
METGSLLTASTAISCSQARPTAARVVLGLENTPRRRIRLRALMLAEHFKMHRANSELNVDFGYGGFFQSRRTSSIAWGSSGLSGRYVDKPGTGSRFFEA